MISFTCKFAGTCVGIQALYEETKEFCRDYLVEESPQFSVVVSQEDILKERRQAEKTSVKEFGHVVNYPDTYLETLAVYRKIAEGMLDYNTILFHGSAIAVDGEAYLFTAKSGTGKSTHTRLWRERFGERAYMVNDDKPLLRITEEGVYVCGTPWDGKHHLSRNVMVPLKAICQLERAADNYIESISRKEMFPVALQQIYRPADAERMRKTLELSDRLLQSTGLYRLGCNMNPEAAIISYEGMQ